MNRRNFLKSSAALTLSTAVLKTRAIAQQPLHVYDRPLHFVYANSHGPCFTYSVNRFMNLFAQVTQGITALNPFFLNVTDPSPYLDMINAVAAQNIAIIPGVGGDPQNGPAINDISYKNMAKAVRPYTNYIRLENMQGFYDYAGGKPPIQDMINYCANTLGFGHIMLNPWPKNSNGDIIPFTNPEIDASFNQVYVNWDHVHYKVNPDPDNWKVNTTEVNNILQVSPQCRIVVNYESAPQHELLAHLSVADQKNAFTTTETQCKNNENNLNLHWCAPFTQVYDPVVQGTWDFESNLLNQLP